MNIMTYESPGHRIGVSALAGAGAGMLGGILLIAAVAKAVQPDDTLRTLSHVLDRIPVAAAWAPVVLVCVLIGVEWVIGLLLLSRVAPIVSITGAAVLLSAFTGVLAWLAATRAPVGCGCGLASSPNVGIPDVARTGLLALLAGAVLVVERAQVGSCGDSG